MFYGCTSSESLSLFRKIYEGKTQLFRNKVQLLLVSCGRNDLDLVSNTFFNKYVSEEIARIEFSNKDIEKNISCNERILNSYEIDIYCQMERVRFEIKHFQDINNIIKRPPYNFTFFNAEFFIRDEKVKRKFKNKLNADLDTITDSFISAEIKLRELKEIEREKKERENKEQEENRIKQEKERQKEMQRQQKEAQKRQDQMRQDERNHEITLLRIIEEGKTMRALKGFFVDKFQNWRLEHDRKKEQQEELKREQNAIAEEKQRQRDFELKKMELQLQIEETKALREREERQHNRDSINSLRDTLKGDD